MLCPTYPALCFWEIVLIQGNRYIRSFLPLDDLERKARYPTVDKYGHETSRLIVDQAGSHGE